MIYPLRFTTDFRRERLHLRLEDRESAQAALDQSLVLLGGMPDLWSWDWIVEAPTVPDDASVQQIARLAGHYVRPDRRALTVLVSGDRFLHLWAQVMNHQFPGRTHLVRRSVTEAQALLETHSSPADSPVGLARSR